MLFFGLLTLYQTLFFYLSYSVNGLRLKINEETIFKRPISTASIQAGINFLLTEGDYSSLAQLLRIQSLDLQKMYVSWAKKRHIPYFAAIYELFLEGSVPVEDAKILLPVPLIADCSQMCFLVPEELFNLPANPLTNDLFMPDVLPEQTLIASLVRGLKERDPMMCWSDWPSIIPTNFEDIWTHLEIWRILLIEPFCDSQFNVKMKFLYALKTAVERIMFPSKKSINELMMINISLVSFYLEHCRAKSKKLNGDFYFYNIDELENEFILIFALINDNRITNDDLFLFKSLNLYSTTIVSNAKSDLLMNPFYYEARIELFFHIIERLKGIHDVFADWFGNLYFIFSDVISKMSFPLLVKSWKLFLKFKPSVEAICRLLSWLHTRINEEYRFKLAKEIPEELLLLLYRKCDLAFIPNLFELVPFEIRKMEYLKNSRSGTKESYIYELYDFWKPCQIPIVLILKIFQEIESTELMSVDLFETMDTLFTLEKYSRPIEMRKFLQIILNLFLKVKEWFIPIDETTIIPSPLFPSQFAPYLAQLIIRCRHLICVSPFKISEIYLSLAFSMNMENFTKQKVLKFVKSQVKYLSNSNINRLPKLTYSYTVYYDQLTKIRCNQNSYQDFFNNHYSLYQIINHLRYIGNDPEVGDLSTGQLAEVEEKIYGNVSDGLSAFGSTFHNLLGGFSFSHNELYSFLYKH